MGYKKFRKMILILSAVILLPFLWWFLFGAGVGVTRDYLRSVFEIPGNRDVVLGVMTKEDAERIKQSTEYRDALDKHHQAQERLRNNR